MKAFKDAFCVLFFKNNWLRFNSWRHVVMTGLHGFQQQIHVNELNIYYSVRHTTKNIIKKHQGNGLTRPVDEKSACMRMQSISRTLWFRTVIRYVPVLPSCLRVSSQVDHTRSQQGLYLDSGSLGAGLFDWSCVIAHRRRGYMLILSITGWYMLISMTSDHIPGWLDETYC